MIDLWRLLFYRNNEYFALLLIAALTGNGVSTHRLESLAKNLVDEIRKLRRGDRF